jgi:hypothetical protein
MSALEWGFERYPGDGSCGDISSSDAFLRLSGTSCIGAEARGYGVSNERTEE